MTRVWTDEQLRAYLAGYQPASAVMLDDLDALVATTRLVLSQRDQARSECVRLAIQLTARTGERPAALQAVHDELAQAAREPHGQDMDHVIDAMLELLAYVERMPAPVEAKL